MTPLRTCINDAILFCYTYGQFTMKGNRRKLAIFTILKLGDQGIPWAPQYVFNTCKEHIRQ